jgi:hypothetical protein
MNRTPNGLSLCIGFIATFLVLAGSLLPALAFAQELTYEQYRVMAWSADRMDHLTQFEPLHGETGMFMALGERFGTVMIFKYTPQGGERVWKSNQLGGVPEELLVADMDGDGLDDALICRTSTAKIYVWSLEDYRVLWESLSGEFQSISCFTVANVDDDAATEIVMLANNKVIYVDGENFNRDFTSLNDYQGTMIRCGDVDGDGSVEIVLNTGKVLDSRSGDVEWEEEPFMDRIELLDIDADGMPEVLTEAFFGGPVKVYDMDYGNEVRFQ